MAIGDIDVGRELLNVPMGEMISSMALAIADAQWSLDKASMVVTELMSGQRLLRDMDSGKLTDGDGHATGTPTVIDSRVFFGYDYDDKGKRVAAKVSMMELGFVPTFYQFVDTIIEVKIAISVTGSRQFYSSSKRTDAKVKNTVANNYRYSGYWWRRGGATATRTSDTNVSTSQVNAAYANRYGYSVEASSLLRTKLVPVPAPAILEDRIRNLMEIEQQRRADGIADEDVVALVALD